MKLAILESRSVMAAMNELLSTSGLALDVIVAANRVVSASTSKNGDLTCATSQAIAAVSCLEAALARSEEEIRAGSMRVDGMDVAEAQKRAASLRSNVRAYNDMIKKLIDHLRELQQDLATTMVESS